jgi:hypothetical protein
MPVIPSRKAKYDSQPFYVRPHETSTTSVVNSAWHWQQLTLFVLLVLVVTDHLSEQGGIFRAQLLRHGGRCRTVGGVLEVSEERGSMCAGDEKRKRGAGPEQQSGDKLEPQRQQSNDPAYNIHLLRSTA